MKPMSRMNIRPGIYNALSIPHTLSSMRELATTNKLNERAILTKILATIFFLYSQGKDHCKDTTSEVASETDFGLWAGPNKNTIWTKTMQRQCMLDYFSTCTIVVIVWTCKTSTSSPNLQPNERHGAQSRAGFGQTGSLSKWRVIKMQQSQVGRGWAGSSRGRRSGERTENHTRAEIVRGGAKVLRLGCSDFSFLVLTRHSGRWEAARIEEIQTACSLSFPDRWETIRNNETMRNLLILFEQKKIKPSGLMSVGRSLIICAQA